MVKKGLKEAEAKVEEEQYFKTVRDDGGGDHD